MEVGKDLKSLFWVYTVLNEEIFLHLGNSGNYSNTTIWCNENEVDECKTRWI